MSEWIIVAVVGVVLLFGAKKLPDMARGLGQSMRIIKAETRGLEEDDERGPERHAVDPAAPTPATPVQGSAPDRSQLRE